MTADPRLESARRTGFYPLVLLLERLTGESGAGRVGTDAAPDEERIRFRHDPALAFSVADVTAVRATADDAHAAPDGTAAARYEVTTTFLGLSGAVSPLPPHLAEEVAREEPDAPRTREFLDLFHHRILSLLFRALARCDLPNAARTDAADPWTPRVLALLGVDAALPTARAPIEPWRLLRLAPLLAEHGVGADALAAALEDALAEELDGAGVDVEPFAGGWVEVAEDATTALGRRSSRLGQDLLLGRRVLDAGGRIRVVIGPLSAAGYARFARGGAALTLVRTLLDALVDEPLEREVVLVLRDDATPALRLGAARLGRDAHLAGKSRTTRVRVDLA